MGNLIGGGDCEAAGLECPNGHPWLNPIPARPGEYECSYFGCGWQGELPEREYAVEIEFSYQQPSRAEDSKVLNVTAIGEAQAKQLACQVFKHKNGQWYKQLKIESVEALEVPYA